MKITPQFPQVNMLLVSKNSRKQRRKANNFLMPGLNCIDYGRINEINTFYLLCQDQRDWYRDPYNKLQPISFFQRATPKHGEIKSPNTIYCEQPKHWVIESQPAVYPLPDYIKNSILPITLRGQYDAMPYVMSSLCKNHFLQQLYRKIDGAVLLSQNERNLDCMITFQTHSILQRFMLRFDLLQLDCNDHLYVYDGAHAVGSHKADLSCRNTKQSVGSIFTRTNFVTLKYVTDNWGTDANGFKLVITAVKDSKHSCKDFRCEYRDFCIHPDLVCDNVNHCGDNSDESASNLCQNQEQTTLLGLELTWFVLIAVSSLLVICACIVGWTICLCRRTPRNQNQNSIQLRHTAETNGSSKHLHGTLPREHTALPPISGNLYHPAGPLGYLRIQHKLLMMAKVRPIWYLINLGN
ncbi:uncharacterized protein LOC129612169 [Condylostylus longicornis]|uniref:uncharacterized protein LOC129612169 n=1 Tax=Condylostylus longicornis TaxID=2530218 RepID=UPI00244DDAD4|nr:uncharacterized protein LOC129612169 [Condylostylus longicornis]